MAVMKLEAAPRTITKHSAREVRETGQVPGEIYGLKKENSSVSVDDKSLGKILETHGESVVLDLSVAGNNEPVVLQDLQVHPVTGDFVHVDFLRINMDEPITVPVHFEFVGTSPAIKELGGVLVKNMTEIDVTCLPADVPLSISVDLTKLVTFDDKFNVTDLIAIEGLTFNEDDGRNIAVVNKPRSDAELAALDEEVTENVDDIEATAEKKEEEGAEGEDAAEDAPKEEEKKEEKPAE